MKKLALLILALMGQPVFAQQTSFEGEWDCIGRAYDEPLRVCSAFCDGVGLDWNTFPGDSMECPGSEYGTPGDDAARCEALLNQTAPLLCCPPGAVCARAEQPAPTSSSSSGGGGATRR